MRTLNNPYKANVPVPRPPIVSLLVVTHYTEHVYHKNRMPVVQLCLESLLKGVEGVEHELIIWDNGSLPEFRKMLMGYKPTIFIQSINIGAHNARHALMEMARAKVICMTDDDILFHPDWFHLQLEVLKTYPNVAVVSGSPSRLAFRKAIDSNLTWQKANQETVKMYSGELMPPIYAEDFARSIGSSPERVKRLGEQFQDILFEYKGVKAWAHGHHMQFLAYRDVIAPFIKRNFVYLENSHLFNLDPDAAGLLNLTTYRRTAVHIGNEIDDSIQRIYREMNGIPNESGRVYA